MGLKSFTKKDSLISKICSVVLTLAMVAGMIVGYAPINAGTKAEVQAASTTSSAPYRNVVYYGDWSIYSGQKYFYPSKIDGSLITHLNFAFMDVDANGNLVLCDEHADFQAVLPEQTGLTYGDPYAGVLGAMAILRIKYPNMKIGISVGGWTRSGDFPALAASATARQNFAKNIGKFVDYLGFDFVDIDWEYPTADRDPDPAGNGVTIDKGCKGSEADTENFTLLMQDLRKELDNLGEQGNKYYELSVAMSASPKMMAKIEYDKVMQVVDFANMMTYDLNGAWGAFTAHQTALYVNDAYDPETQPDGVFSVDTCIKYLEDTYGDAIDMSKIVVGVAPYTRGWAGVQNDGRDPENPGLYATAEPNSVKADDGVMSGTFAYGEIDRLIGQYQLKEYYDEKAEAAYYYSAETGYFFTCDNERSVAAKGKYVREKKLGGLISWMASLDSANSVTQVMHDSLYGSTPLPAQEIKVANPKASATITASGTSTYTITLKNNETTTESNTALRNAELFKKTITLPKLYIKSRSGATFSFGSECGTVTNENGYGVLDLSGVYAAKSMKPGGSHTFSVNVSGTANVSDIESITMTRRILTSLDEFGEQIIYQGVEVPSEQESGSSGEKPTKYPEWNSSTAYSTGDKVIYNDKVYEAQWWTQGETPGSSSVWKLLDETVVEPETPTEPETPVEPTIDGGIEINGFQLSNTIEGMRTIYSSESVIDGKQVLEVGMIYSLVGYAEENDLYVGSKNQYVRSYNATSKGVSSHNFSDSSTATSYVMTMKFGPKTADEFNAEWRVRAYAKLSDGTYVYTAPETYSISSIAEYMYQNSIMPNKASHDYLFTGILRVVDPAYKEKAFNLNKALA